jgi:hypothetical protein
LIERHEQDTLLRAIEDARLILSDYIEPRPDDSVRIVERLLAFLDNENVVHALGRLKQRKVLRLVDKLPLGAV